MADSCGGSRRGRLPVVQPVGEPGEAGDDYGSAQEEQRGIDQRPQHFDVETDDLGGEGDVGHPQSSAIVGPDCPVHRRHQPHQRQPSPSAELSHG